MENPGPTDLQDSPLCGRQARATRGLSVLEVLALVTIILPLERALSSEAQSAASIRRHASRMLFHCDRADIVIIIFAGLNSCSPLWPLVVRYYEHRFLAYMTFTVLVNTVSILLGNSLVVIPVTARQFLRVSAIPVTLGNSCRSWHPFYCSWHLPVP